MWSRPLLAALLVVCSCREEPEPVPTAKPREGLPFAYVDVAESMGYTLRNRTGQDGQKNYILEAMAPGVAVASRM